MSEQFSPEEVIAQAQEARRRGEFRAISLPHADLSGAHLAGADLVGADFEGADLTGAILAGAHLARANLKKAVLVGASLDGADLTDADLRGADLAGARIDDAVLANARLEGACLQAVFGDPLSMTAARMDQVTIELSEFTMRDIAQMVVRGVDVREHEIVPVSVAEPLLKSSDAPSGVAPLESGMLSILPLVTRDGVHERASQTGRFSVPQAPLPRGIVITEAPSSAEDPVSSKEIVAPLNFDRRLSSIPEIRRALSSIPPPAQQASLLGPSALGLLPSSRSPSIIPAFRAAEISARLEQANGEQEQMPVSQRMFLQLSALIDDARMDAGSPVSLRPQRQDVKKLTAGGFEFPMPGDTYLGVTVLDEMERGTTSRCFFGKTADGIEAVVRIFDPHCEGAALQLPAFQRGLRAINRLQGLTDPDIAVVELLSVASDQTAYVSRHYPGKSLLELLDVSMSLQVGLEALVSLAKTMAAIHRQGLMVRSWKPSNVLVDGFHLLLSEPDMVHLATLAQYRGDAGGYKAYAAPEELLGRGTRSPTADIFSLGKMLEFLLTGQEPLVPLGSPPLISQRENIPAVLVDLVKRATAQEPTERYQSVEDLLADIKAFQEKGDRAVLLAPIRPLVVSQLSIPPMSTGPEVPNVEALVRERIKAKKAGSQEKPATLAWPRQVELGAALIGGLGGLAVTTLMVLAPRSVDYMNGARIYLAAAIGLGALALPVPALKRIPYRLGTWFGLATLVWLLDPIQLAQFTWKRQLQSGSEIEKQAAVKSLSRIGRKDASGAQLDGVRFDELDLDSLNFRGASLKNADFKKAFLVEAQFDGADITGASFQGANLFGASIAGAIGLEEAACDRYTILPVGLICEGGTIARGTVEPDEGQ